MPSASLRRPARDRILDTAEQLFYTHGIRAVGVDKVIAEAKVAKATLYTHFRSKDELVAECLRRDAARVRAGLAEAARTTPPGPARIGVLFDRAAASAAEPGYQGCGFINAAAEHLPGPVGDIIAMHRADVLTFLMENVDREAEDERVAVARVILALLDGAKVASTSTGPAAFTDVRPTALALATYPLPTVRSE
jgi:AcrR family transcriptional regulator